MNRTLKIILRVAGAIGLFIVALVVGFILWLYITNRTYDQTLAVSLPVSSEWTEIEAVPQLQTRRRVVELAMTIPNYRAERGGPFEIKLPDGRIVQPQIQIVDSAGNVFELKQSGFSFSTQDIITFTPKGGFPENTYSKMRIRSDEPFVCERIFWRERNPK